MRELRRATAALLALVAGCSASHDWPMFGRDASRNAVSPEKDPPTDWAVKEGEERSLLWQARVGDYGGGTPVVSSGLVWVGNSTHYDFVLRCFSARTGRPVWTRKIPIRKGVHPSEFDLGLQSAVPLVEGDRLWIMAAAAEVVCFDIGPLKQGTGEPRELWRVDLPERVGVRPYGLGMGVGPGTSIGASHRGMLYVSTMNGVNFHTMKMDRPDAPALVCLDQVTGKVLGREASGISARTTLVNCSSPVVTTGEDGRARVIFGGGDGSIYAFDPVPEGGVLKELWRVDGRVPGRDAQSILATPVVHGGRVYVGLGLEPAGGSGTGNLCCVEIATGRIVWNSIEVETSTATPVVKDGHVFTVATDGYVYALDAATGRRLWVHDALAQIHGSPLWVDGRLFVGTGDGDMLIFDVRSRPAEKPRPEKIGSRVDMFMASPVFCGGTLYLNTGRALYAIRGSVSGRTGEEEPPGPGGRAADAVFLPTPHDVVEKMLELAAVGKGDTLFDLGSGDGRIVIAAAKTRGAKAVGIELDRHLVDLSRSAVEREGVANLARIEHGDLLKADLSGATVVTLYVGRRLNRLLLPKLEKLPPGSRIVSHTFALPGVRPDRTLEVLSREDGVSHTLYLSTTPLKRE